MQALKKTIQQNWALWLAITLCIALITFEYFEIYQNKLLLGLSYVFVAIAYYFSTKKMAERKKLEGKELGFSDIFVSGMVATVWIVMALQSFIRPI